jgi:hypothetical protein
MSSRPARAAVTALDVAMTAKQADSGSRLKLQTEAQNQERDEKDPAAEAEHPAEEARHDAHRERHERFDGRRHAPLAYQRRAP